MFAPLPYTPAKAVASASDHLSACDKMCSIYGNIPQASTKENDLSSVPF